MPCALPLPAEANATGAYSGVEYKGPRGIGGSSRSYATLGETWLRGAQLLDADGSAQFDTIFPGYYARRTTHIHLMVHTRETRAQANGTLLDNHASHVGQLYFDQELIDQVGAADVYRTNRENVTTNAHDRFLSSAVGAMSDPFMEYVLLGSKVEDGLLGWLSFGINTTLVREVHNAATHYAGGDKVNPPDPRLKHPPRSQKSVVAAARRS